MYYKVPAHAVFREMDGKAIVLNVDTGQYYTLNEMGTRMWVLLQEKGSLADIVEVIEAEYDVGHEKAVADLEAFVMELRKSGLVEQILL